MKSGESHCTHELASDVRRGRKKEEGGRKEDVLIKSNNPHLAGGEKHGFTSKSHVFLGQVFPQEIKTATTREDN